MHSLLNFPMPFRKLKNKRNSKKHPVAGQMLFTFKNLLNLKGRRVDHHLGDQHMKKKIIKIMLAVLFLWS